MKTTILSCSSRPNNGTFRVAKAIRNLIADSIIVDFRSYDLPAFNGDLSQFGKTEFQKELINGIKEADLLIVLTPEYNWFPSAEIINTIHLLGGSEHAHIFDNMTAAFVGVSAGRGGRMPAVQLGYVFNKVFQFFNLNSITSPKSFESQSTQQCIEEDGTLKDNDLYNKGLKDFVSYNLKVAKRWQQ